MPFRKCLHCDRKALGYIKGEDDIDPKLCSKCNIKLMCDDSSDDEECNEEECAARKLQIIGLFQFS